MKVFALYEDEYKYYIVSELMLGKDLLVDLQTQSIGAYNQQKVAKYARQILLALNHCHNQGVVHRDLKLDNIMFADPSGETLKIVDFGFAKIFPPKTKESDEVLGTPLYMAPEVVSGKEYDAKCDIWSCGIIIYILLCGELPYGEIATQGLSLLLECIAHHTFNKENDMKSGLWLYTSSEAKNFVLRMLERDQTK